MKVKQLIAELQKQNPEKEVFIQQSDEYKYEYMQVETVKESRIMVRDYELKDKADTHEDELIEAVLIEFT